MTATLRKLRHTSALCALMMLYGNTAYAAPGTLATAPLFVSTAVEPNIFLTLDDSGSMGWEHMVADGAAGFSANSGRPLVGNTFRQHWHPDPYTDTRVMPPVGYVHSDPTVTWDEDMWVMRNHNVNTLYYNPDTEYTPWQGFDTAGNPLYGAAVPTAVRFDPDNASNVTDLTKTFNFFDYDDCNCWRNNSLYIPSYYVWNDQNSTNPALANNGIVDPSDDHTLIEIKTGNTFPSGRSYEKELQNFANWFQYYVKREYAAKAAIGGVITNTDAARMGLDIFNLGHQVDVETMTDPNKKVALLNSFYNIPSSGHTPARTALKRVGELFRKNTAPAPILSAAKGGECQQNFNIVMTDGFWNGATPSGIGNADHSTSADGGFDGDQNESIDGGNYEDSASATLADVAMHYYETDLRTDLGNHVPTSPGIDLADHQHLVTYTVAFGLTGTLDPLVDDPLSAGFTWPTPASNQATTIDDLWHAAYNGRGQYLSAQNPEELEAALNVAIDDIAERTATASAASVTSARLTTDSVVYLSEFNTNRWQGNLFAFPILGDPDNDEILTIDSANPAWNAAEVLDNRVNPRTILTYDNTSDAGSVKDGIPFQWNSITAAMKADLRVNASGTTDSDTIAQYRLNYIRGDRSNEGAGEFFRERATLLGDIVNSGPVYVADPNLRWPDEAPFPTGSSAYSKFKESLSDDPNTPGDEGREGVIYVGANDGMIHAFSENGGHELMAYIPSNLFSTDSGKGLHYLTQQNYIHQYYNDLSPTVSDVYINNGGSTSWRTIMVAGQRGGGRGYSALDVTDPSSFNEGNAASTVLWEFTSDNDPDLGFTFSRPQIGMTNDNEWVAVFGNGYNDTGDGQAKLFIVKIAAGIDGAWAVSDYTEITTNEGSPTDRNGLATPALADLDGNGTIDRAYAGDLRGKMWVFDLSGTTSSSWGLANTQPLFTTIGNSPITSQPSLSRHPSQSTVESPAAGANEPNIMVAFGSGQYLVSADQTPNQSNHFYGVWDRGVYNRTAGNLVTQTISLVDDFRVVSNNPVDYNIDFGWHIFLEDPGERAITNSIIRSNIVFFNTAVPTANDPCSVGGYGYRFAVDLETGGTPDDPVIDQDENGIVDEKDTVGPNKDVVPSAERFERILTDDTITEKHIINDRQLKAIQTAPRRQVGRVSWQELLQ